MSDRPERIPLNEPTLIRETDAIKGMWGNEISKFVPTLFYGLSKELMMLSLTIKPGEGFRAYAEFRAYFASQLCLYVIEGQYTYQNPETGEVRTAQQGEILFFHEKLWNYGHNFGDKDVRILEIFSPPANAATLADTPIPEKEKFINQSALDHMKNLEGGEGHNPRLRNDQNAVESLIPGEPNIWTRVYASTDQIFMAKTSLLPSQYSKPIIAPYDMVIYTIAGQIEVVIERTGEKLSAEKADIIFIPANEAYMIINNSNGMSVNLVAGSGSFSSIYA